MDRKTFIKKAMGTMLVTIPLYSISGCSSSEDGTPVPDPKPNPQANCIDNGTASTIGANHGHTLTVSKSDVGAAAEKTYSIQGSSTHDHVVTITAANFTSLMNNSAISVTSTSGSGHTHNVTVSCA